MLTLPYSENMLLAMLVNAEKIFFNKAMMQIPIIRKIKSTKNNSNKSEERLTTSSTFDNFIRRFLIPSLNFDAACYYE